MNNNILGEYEKKSFRLGEKGVNTYGSEMEIVIYNGARDIWVKFLEHENLVHTAYHSFSNGKVKNPYDKTIYGVGYLGEGKYKGNENKKRTPQYETWKNMMMRCYSEKYHLKEPSYKECFVDEEWHNFQNFAKWYDENYYKVNGEEMSLDKDILVKGNKIYSPKYCIFAPRFINQLIVKNDASRGLLPLGVCLSEQGYQVTCSKRGERYRYIGRFKTPKEAFEAYKSFKENYIKEVANQYKNEIPDKLYNALINYIVEIDD